MWENFNKKKFTIYKYYKYCRLVLIKEMDRCFLLCKIFKDKKKHFSLKIIAKKTKLPEWELGAEVCNIQNKANERFLEK